MKTPKKPVKSTKENFSDEDELQDPKSSKKLIEDDEDDFDLPLDLGTDDGFGDFDDDDDY